MNLRVRLTVPVVTAAACVATTVAVAVAATTLPGVSEHEPQIRPQLAAFEAALVSGPEQPQVVPASAGVGGVEVVAESDELAGEVSSATDGSSLWHWLQVADWLGFVGPYGTGATDYAAAANAAVGNLSSVSAAEGGYANAGALGAVAFALSKIGTPYLWGGTGPLYDCSGLMLRAYESVGVRLPRVSRHQFLVGERVDVQTLVPGDMVFFAHDVSRPSSIHHVAMYIGGGQMVHAPYTGARVRVDKLRVRGLIGAVRMLPASGVPTVPPTFDIPGLPPAPLPTTATPTPTDTPTSEQPDDTTPTPKPVPSGITPTLVTPTLGQPPVATLNPTLINPPITTLNPTLINPPITTLVNPPIVIGPPIATLVQPPPPMIINPPPPLIYTGPIRPNP